MCTFWLNMKVTMFFWLSGKNLVLDLCPRKSRGQSEWIDNFNWSFVCLFKVLTGTFGRSSKGLGAWLDWTNVRMSKIPQYVSTIHRSPGLDPYVVRWWIWYHLHNLKNAKNTHGGVLILVKLQALSLQLY